MVLSLIWAKGINFKLALLWRGGGKKQGGIGACDWWLGLLGAGYKYAQSEWSKGIDSGRLGANASRPATGMRAWEFEVACWQMQQRQKTET